MNRVGWADVATKRDLEQLEARLDLRFEAFEQRLLATFRAELNAQTRTMVQWLIFATTGATVAVGGLAFAAARLV
ncbi:MAG: hypothetical protein ACRDKB_00615 [Actinomycetota bacterium]